MHVIILTLFITLLMLNVLQDAVVAEKGLALIAAAAQQIATLPEVLHLLQDFDSSNT